MRVKKQIVCLVSTFAIVSLPNVILAASITGKLIDEVSKEPIGTMGRLTLYMYKEENCYPWARIGFTNSDPEGNFAFLGLGAGTYVIYGDCSGYFTERYYDLSKVPRLPFRVTGKTVERATHIVLDEDQEIGVTVNLLPKPKTLVPSRLDIELRRLSYKIKNISFQIFVMPLNSGRTVHLGPRTKVGRTYFELLPGKYRIEVSARCFRKRVIDNFAKTAEDQILVIEIGSEELTEPREFDSDDDSLPDGYIYGWEHEAEVPRELKVLIGPYIGYHKVKKSNEGNLYSGVHVGLPMSRRLVIAGSIEYRQEHENTEVRVSKWPVMATVMFYPLRSIYTRAGVGVYNTTSHYTSERDTPRDKVQQGTQRKVGWHIGAGIELPFSRIVSLIGDIRYVVFGNPSQEPSDGRLSNFWAISSGIMLRL